MTTASSIDYELFIESVQPTVISLSNSSTKLNRDEYFRINRESDREAITRNLEAGYKVKRVTESFFDVVASVDVSISHPRLEGPALEVRCAFDCHFHATVPVTEAHAKRFAQNELRLVVWPYFRMFVSDMTCRMAIPPVVIPMTLRKAPPAVAPKAQKPREKRAESAPKRKRAESAPKRKPASTL